MSAAYWIAWGVVSVLNVALFFATRANLRATKRLLDEAYR